MSKKTPCIKCNQELWDYIRPRLEKWGYNIAHISKWDTFNILVTDFMGATGLVSNVTESQYYTSFYTSFRELITNVEEFLTRAAKLKGFEYKPNN